MAGHAAACATLRRRLAAWLQAEGYASDPRIADAFAAVPRHWFLRRFYMIEGSSFVPARFDPEHPDPALLRAIYANQALVTRLEEGIPVSSSSEPAVMAVMLEGLKARPGDTVLEVGTGTGYNAALLAHLVGPAGRVVSLDIDPSITREARDALGASGYPQVEVHTADGRRGWTTGAPYDRIIVTAASRLRRAWVEQLRDGGTLVLPFAVEPSSAPVLWLRRKGGLLEGRFCLFAHFMPLRSDPPAPHRGSCPPLATVHRSGSPVPRLTDLWDLALFLALEAPRSFHWGLGPDGLRVPALQNEGGVAAGSPGGLLASGLEPPLRTLGHLLDRWERLDRPRLGSYTVRAWIGTPPAHLPANTWLLAGDLPAWVSLL